MIADPTHMMRSIHESLKRDHSPSIEFVMQRPVEISHQVMPFIVKKKGFPSAARMAKRSGSKGKRTRK